MSSGGESVFFVSRAERGRLRLTGRDRQSFLHALLTNDVLSRQPGQGCYAFLLDSTGHVLSDMRVLCAEDHVLLDLEPGMAPLVAETLDKYLIMEKCRITDVTDAIQQVFIGGPEAPALLAGWGVERTEEWAEGANAPVEIAGETGLVAATRLVPGYGFDLYTGETVVETLRSLGAKEVSPETLETGRIEAGVPRFGVDMDSRVLAPETGLQQRAINYRKGCYVGQEIVARIDARGHTNRTLVGLLLDSDGAAPLPPADTPLAAGERDDAGRITSAAFSPTLNRSIALGYLRHEFSTPGTVVTAAGQSAQVAELPFVR